MGRVLVHFQPRFAAIGAAFDVRALLVDADERSLVAGDDFAFGNGGGEITPSLDVGGGAGSFATEPELVAYDAQGGALRAGGVRAGPGFASIGAGPGICGVFVGHDEQAAVAEHLAATGGGIETFWRDPFPGLAEVIAGEKIAKLRA